MTSRAADAFGLGGRGRIVPGAFADLVLLDPAVVADLATYRTPVVSPAGVHTVLIAGREAVRAGRPGSGRAADWSRPADGRHTPAFHHPPQPKDTRHTMSSIPLPDPHSALDLLRDMIRVDSRTETPGEGELARRLVARMRDAGLETELIPVSPGRFNAVGRLRGTGGGESLMFNGHLDTNPLTEGWTVDPWGGVTDDRFVYGLGVSNMKAGCASYLAAVETLLTHGTRLRGDVVLTFVVGELQGGVGTLKLIVEGLRADHFVNCEPTDLNALTLHAGSVDFSVELTGATRHLSKREEAVDAIMAACELIPRTGRDGAVRIRTGSQDGE